MSDFAWSGDDSDSVVLTWQPRTAVYETQQGGITIRQEADGYIDDQDDQVFLTPMGALQIAWRLIELAHEIGVPQPNRKAMAKLDLGPTKPPAPLRPANERQLEPDLLNAMQQAAE